MKRNRDKSLPHCDSEIPAFTTHRRLQPYRKKHPPENACQPLDPWADTSLRHQALSFSSSPAVVSWDPEKQVQEKRTKNSVEASRIMTQLERRGLNPLLHPVPDEIGDYIHVYWTNNFRDFLDDARHHVEEQLQSNWLYYHAQEQKLPDAVYRTYMHYILEPAYQGVASFICNNDYREFYLSKELIEELVEETLRGNIVQADSVRYLLRVLEYYPLPSVLRLVQEMKTPISASASKLVHWIEKWLLSHANTKKNQLRHPSEWKVDVQRLFLQQMMWLRLYPQREQAEYEKELRDMIDPHMGEVYQPGQMRQLLSFRLQDKNYYEQLLQSWSENKSMVVLGIQENGKLFLQDLEFFTVPFTYDSHKVRKPLLEKHPAGYDFVVLIEKEVNPIMHPLLTNLFLPLPTFTQEAIQQLLTTQLQIEHRICGHHHQAVLEGELQPYRQVSGVIPVFQPIPQQEHILLHHRPSRGLCTTLALSATVLPKIPDSEIDKLPLPLSTTTTTTRWIKKVVTYQELARNIVNILNQMNRDDLRQLYADAYPELTQKPILLTYTGAYGPDVTEAMLQRWLRAQIESQLERFWNSVEARFVLQDSITPVYTVLSVALYPSFNIFLSPEEKDMVLRAWEGFESSVQPFIQSPQACKPTLPLTRAKELKCVLINSSLLMKQPPQRLRDYLGKDIAQGA